MLKCLQVIWHCLNPDSAVDGFDHLLSSPEMYMLYMFETFWNGDSMWFVAEAPISRSVAGREITMSMMVSGMQGLQGMGRAIVDEMSGCQWEWTQSYGHEIHHRVFIGKMMGKWWWIQGYHVVRHSHKHRDVPVTQSGAIKWIWTWELVVPKWHLSEASWLSRWVSLFGITSWHSEFSFDGSHPTILKTY